MSRNKTQTLARQKAKTLTKLFFGIQKSVQPQKTILSLNTLFLTHACEACFSDLANYQEFHKIEMPDNHKRAAFIFKWIAKFRPVSVQSFIAGSNQSKVLFINSYYALLAALQEINVNMDSFAPSDFAKHIIYSAEHRNIDAPAWAIIFCALEKMFPAPQ